MKIKIKKINSNIQIPLKQSEGACCADVVINEIIKTNNWSVTVKLGFCTEFEKGYKGCIVPRSSFTQKGWIMQNSPAQIDSDYRGEWMIKFEAIPIDCYKFGKSHILIYPAFPYKIGERCAQIFFEKELEYTFEEVEELSNTERNDLGFGSSGK